MAADLSCRSTREAAAAAAPGTVSAFSGAVPLSLELRWTTRNSASTLATCGSVCLTWSDVTSSHACNWFQLRMQAEAMASPQTLEVHAASRICIAHPRKQGVSKHWRRYTPDPRPENDTTHEGTCSTAVSWSTSGCRSSAGAPGNSCFSWPAAKDAWLRPAAASAYSGLSVAVTSNAVLTRERHPNRSGLASNCSQVAALMASFAAKAMCPKSACCADAPGSTIDG